MAGLIVVCERAGRGVRSRAEDARRCAALIEPDVIRAHEPVVTERDGLTVAVVNPVEGMAIRDDGVCLGAMLGDPGAWWQPGSASPEGTYVLLRHDERRLELVSDVLATRTLWYTLTDETFFASTSQRALVALLGSFELNREAVTWMVTCGSLGGTSWDARLTRLSGDSRLALDRRGWTLGVTQRPAVRDAGGLSDAEHLARMQAVVLDACAQVTVPTDRWLLPLSGGIDSRVLLLGLLRAGKAPCCVTWGVRESLGDPAGDAAVAQRLAAALGVEHEFRQSDRSTEPAEVVVRRFLDTCEGLTVDIGGYVDGMTMWASFFDGGIEGIIRGDEPALGYYGYPSSEVQVRRWKGIVFLSEFPPDHPIHRLGLVEQSWDTGLDRREGESLRAWDDRLWEGWKYPSQLAPLNTTKCAFVEVVSPMQSRMVVEVARQLPDHLRMHDVPLAAISRSLGPDIPFATRGALGGIGRLLSTDSFLAAVAEAFSADEAEGVLPRPALAGLVGGLARGAGERASRPGLVERAKERLPQRLKDRIRPVWPVRLSAQDMTFRAFIAVYMAARLRRDAGWLAP